MIAALFVETGGVYYNLSNVDSWDILRNAKNYEGSHKVIAHPPCQRWGRYWSGGPSAKVRRKLGDDDGCFESALKSVRRWGGVLEHPEASYAFKVFGLGKPPKSGGWYKSLDGLGWICCVEQGHYGHKSRKATWLYCVSKNKPAELIWGAAKGKIRMDEGFRSTEERKKARALHLKPLERLSVKERLATPVLFRDLLIKLVSEIE